MSQRGSLNRRAPIVVALAAFMAVGLFGMTAPAVRAAPGDVGQAGPSFAGSGADPTSSKPESKVWFNDGFWWASMYRSTASAFTIHRLSGTTWTDTGVAIDDRESTHQDVLWDQAAGRLYVASHVFSTSPSSGNPARLYRFSYNAGSDTYSLDGGFPQTINDWSSETLVIDKDSTGQLWATWTRGSAVRVNRTTSGDQNWGAEFQPAGTTGSMSSDDISTLVSFGGDKIGLMWSRQSGSPDSFGFAIHDDSAADTTWGATTAVYSGNNFADDHINLKADSTGNLFAVVKTSLTSGANIVVLKRSTGGTWTNAVFSTGQGTMTRGVLAIDTTNNLLRVFATAPEANGTIYTKTSPLGSLSFSGGLGTQFIRDNSPDDLNNATTTKQTVNSTTGLLVLAGHETLNEYWWNLDDLGGGPPPGGDTITLTSAADAQVKSTSPTTNYGSLNSLRTREDAGAGDTYRSYLTFNVAGVTGTVNSVKLRLFATDVTPNVQSVFSGDPTSWSEGALNWNNRPAFTTLRGSGPTNTAGYNEITLDPAMITGNVPISLLVQSASTNSGVYNSREASANRPQLVITQTAGNAPPTASPVSKSTPHDVATTINMAGTDAETCELTFVAPATGPTHGSLGAITNAACVAGSPNNDSATVVYTPTAGYHGPDSFTYTVSDGTNPPVSATVTLTVTNAGPTATGSSQTTPENTLKTVPLAGGDADDCELVFAVGTGPTHGTLGSIAPGVCSGTGPFTNSATVDYTPTTGYNGPDSFTFTVSDGVTTSAPATVSITVGTPPNAPPTASPVSKSTPHDVATTINMAGTDAETCELTFVAPATGPTHGSLGAITNAACVAGSPNNDSATVVYTPTAGYHGPDSFTYTVSDGTNPPVSATVTLTVTNAGPTATGSSQTTTQGNPVTFNLTGTDVDDCNLVFTAPSTTSKGTLSAPGALACTPGSPNTDRASITYTPNAGQTGADSFTFTVSDGVTTSAPATVNITINAGAPTTVTFVPVADAHVSSSNVGGNFGTISTVKVREGDGSVANPNYRGYFKFNLSGISGTVSSVKLRLFVTDVTSDIQSVLVVTDNSWTETGITYTNAPTLTGMTVAGSAPAPAAGYVEITLTPTTVSSSTTTLSLAVRSAGTNSAVFSSREDPTNKPQLQVTFQ